MQHPSPPLAEPFSQIFIDQAEANWAFDLLRDTAKRLGIHGPYDPRFALTLAHGSGRLGLHLVVGNWLVLGFHGPSPPQVELALLAQAVSWDERLSVYPSVRKEGEPEVRVYQLPPAIIRPMTSDLQTAYETTLDLIAQKFQNWKRATPWKLHKPEIAAGLFNLEQRERLFAGLLEEAELRYERHLTAFSQDLSEEPEEYEIDEIEPRGEAGEEVAHLGQDLDFKYELQRRNNVGLDPRKLEFSELFEEMIYSYPSTPDGQWHISAYSPIRAQGQHNFKEVISAAEKGEDITELVLLKLLPYAKSSANNEKGSWVHLAPSINGDVKKWFESSGWTKPEEWTLVAEAILNFVRRCNDDPGQLIEACNEFSALPYSKGFQAGMLTPILNALRPDDFSLINNKSRHVVNYLANTSFGQKLVDYPDANLVAHQLVKELADILHHPNAPNLRDDDLFDMFCHWLVAIKKYEFSNKRILADPLQQVNETLSTYHATETYPYSIFSTKTFDLLAGLHTNPTKDFYLAHKDEFREHVEEPFQQLFRRVATQLPSSITEVVETEKKVFARILKNDYGQGGTWDFYWGAFYPKGGKRTEDAQLSMWMNYERLEIGFYIGNYGTAQRKRFLNNCQENYEVLVVLLKDALSEDSIKIGSHENFIIEPDSSVVNKLNLSWQDWLRNPDQGNFDVSVILPKDRVLQYSVEQLTSLIVHTYSKIFPLVLLAISDDPLPEIRRYLGEQLNDKEEIEVVIAKEYPLPQLAEDTGFEQAELARWVRAIERKGQAILYGPPGTGKTFIAEKLAQHLVGGGDGFWDLVQFHPAYAYEDFMQGIRPQSDEGGLSYPLVPGRFLEFCTRARQRQGRCVLIIDEINRANLSRVFGELMYLLEYRRREIPLAGGGIFQIPANVRLIGTMNTADRSIALVDHALRRRFAFLALYPNFELLRRYHQRQQTGFPVEGLMGVLQRLNRQIDDPHYAVGVTFFLTPHLADDLEDIWRMEIEPYLEEYFFDQPGKVDEFRWDAIQSKVAP